MTVIEKLAAIARGAGYPDNSKAPLSIDPTRIASDGDVMVADVIAAAGGPPCGLPGHRREDRRRGERRSAAIKNGEDWLRFAPDSNNRRFAADRRRADVGWCLTCAWAEAAATVRALQQVKERLEAENQRLQAEKQQYEIWRDERKAQGNRDGEEIERLRHLLACFIELSGPSQLRSDAEAALAGKGAPTT